MKNNFYLICLILVLSCNSGAVVDNSNIPTNKLEIPTDLKYFTEVPSDKSNIRFVNDMVQDEVYNVINFEGMVQGAGVGVLDVNNDGLIDIYFCSNRTPDKLYLNQGNMEFKDITQSAGIDLGNAYSSGVTIADVNGDGLDDIYISVFLSEMENERRNKLFINEGGNKFTEKSKEYNIDDSGLSIMSNFFDYDNDGDLDLYVVNQPMNSKEIRDRPRSETINYYYTDRFYRNDGNVFVDVTDKLGFKNYNFSLSATAFDYNNDGWTDIYLAADFEDTDALYENNGDGTFTNVIHDAVKHMSNFSMGVDFADINNDGYQDIYVADMVAEDNYRLKTNMSGMNPEKFFKLVDQGYHYQFMFNAMQLNNGNETFSEVAQFSGISNTDWSWSPLFIDIDLDGYKDLFVTNGLVHEVRNNDFNKAKSEYIKKKRKDMNIPSGKPVPIHFSEIIEIMPSNKIPNVAYRNNGDLTFTKVSKDWGLDYSGWSQGAAYGDLDNDGDLDLIVSNVNNKASILENKASDYHNFLNVKLKGDDGNTRGLNSVIKVYYGNDKKQVQELTPVRGYMSTSEPIVQFGLGEYDNVDKVEVIWPNGDLSVLSNIKGNQTLLIKQKEAAEKYNYSTKSIALFEEMKSSITHYENSYDDYKHEILLPFKLSSEGPCSVVADFNNDGYDDIFVGGSSGLDAIFYLSDGPSYNYSDRELWTAENKYEDAGAHAFDADGDGDVDLYVASGSNEFPEGSSSIQDRLYLNDGSGKFSISKMLPKIKTSTKAIVSNDIDGDGDLDLFVGGRSVPRKYGKASDSYILINNKGKFVDKTSALAPMLKNYGMVKSAIWTDVDGDKNKELIIAGEWMPITILENSNGKLQKRDSNLADSNGWWNIIREEDVDGDGDMDIVAGNLGLNIKYKASKEEPFKLYVDDFDNNGTNDVYLGYYDKDGKCYPVRGRQCSSQQLPFVLNKFKNYDLFAQATIDEVLDERVEETTTLLEAYNFQNGIFVNNGSGQFSFKAFPNEAQLAPVNGIAFKDLDQDGMKDIFIAGNYYDREVETTRSDAGTGLWLMNKGNNSYSTLETKESGIKANNDVREVEFVNRNGEDFLLLTNNNGPIQFYKKVN